jgi:hypothetical protein
MNPSRATGTCNWFLADENFSDGVIQRSPIFFGYLQILDAAGWLYHIWPIKNILAGELPLRLSSLTFLLSSAILFLKCPLDQR